LLLVGGRLTSNGNSTIRGAIISGLNVWLGMTVAGKTQLNGNKTYQYDSCIMDSVSSRLTASLVTVRDGTVTSYPLF